MAKKPLEIQQMFGQDNLSKYIAFTWFNYNSQRRPKIDAWKELRNYIFATDTTTTTNKSLPWKNSTTLPKLTQIRDNLHSNYVSALFPNDDWLRWEAYTLQDGSAAKVKAIEGYMSNKARTGGLRTEASKCLYDYIDYGNCFATVDYESSIRYNDSKEPIVDFIGPKMRRISPLDIVFNPLADSFRDTWKIIRSLKSLGELQAMSIDEPDNKYLQEALRKRDIMVAHMNAYGMEDSDKAEGMIVDGFGNYSEYLQSSYVEVLEFWGDINSEQGDGLRRGRVVTIIDRMYTIRDEAIPTWLGTAPIYHAGWRSRTDNLWAMGPLENLVGMQYRIDHLENLKADAMDLAVFPPLKIIGEVEEFQYGPGAEIHLMEGGDVQEMAHNVQWVIQSDNEINSIEARMEQYAGAPKEAMGIRTAGEKTAFEVQSLMTAAGRIFQEKINNFEIELLENVLNAMLETARRNFDDTDVVRVMDNDLGVVQFLTLTKDDITASGKLRPIGARHFAAQQQMMQNLTGLFNSQIAQVLAPHTSALNLSTMVNDLLGFEKYKVFSPNAAIFEQQETQRLLNQAHEDLQTEQAQGTSAQGVPPSSTVPMQTTPPNK